MQILVEELVRQLMALENNANTFYNPTTFLVYIWAPGWQKGPYNIWLYVE